MNNLNTFKTIFCDLFGCSIGVYHFIPLKTSIKLFYLPKTPNYRELLTSEVIFAINR